MASIYSLAGKSSCALGPRTSTTCQLMVASSMPTKKASTALLVASLSNMAATASIMVVAALLRQKYLFAIGE